MFEIKNWKTGEVIHSFGNTVRECLENGVGLGVSFDCAELNDAELNDAELNDAELNNAKLNYAELKNAKLNNAKLNDAELKNAKLNNAELKNAKLNDAELNNADLSGVTGLLNSADFMSQFKKDKRGILVYKSIGNTFYDMPSKWIVAEGEFITEIPNPNRSVACGCGVNFATLDWCKANFRDSTIWLCRINWIDLSDVAVPYNTDGKARCARLELIRPLDKTK